MLKTFFTIILTLTASIIFAQQTDYNQIIEQKYKINTAFQPGEELIYVLKYGVVKGGEAKLTIGLEEVGYDFLFHAKAVAYTTGMVGKVATIYDVYESYFDVVTGYPIKSIRNVTENRYKRYNEELFGRDSNVVYSMKSGRHEVPHNCLDLVSAFYYARKFVFDQKFQKNETMSLYTWLDEELYKVALRYKKTETIKTRFGKIECLKFVPVLDEKISMFKKEEDMEAWFSNDGNYVPIKIRVNMPFSAVYCELKSYKNLKNTNGILNENSEK